jgi:predicted ATP-dependent serine protease
VRWRRGCRLKSGKFEWQKRSRFIAVPNAAQPARSGRASVPAASEWNTLVESVAEKATGHRFESLAPTVKLQTLSEIEARDVERIATGIGEFDRALGGGLVAGGVVLIGGDPGIGKSTLLLQALSHLSSARTRCFTSAARNPASRSPCAPGGWS